MSLLDTHQTTEDLIKELVNGDRLMHSSMTRQYGQRCITESPVEAREAMTRYAAQDGFARIIEIHAARPHLIAGDHHGIWHAIRWAIETGHDFEEFDTAGTPDRPRVINLDSVKHSDGRVTPWATSLGGQVQNPPEARGAVNAKKMEAIRLVFS